VTAGGSAILIDYDDIVLTDRITSFEAFCEKLLESPHVRANPSAYFVCEGDSLTPIGQALKAAKWTVGE
jgi:hypothetical protein